MSDKKKVVPLGEAPDLTDEDIAEMAKYTEADKKRAMGMTGNLHQDATVLAQGNKGRVVKKLPARFAKAFWDAIKKPHEREH